jgi:ABC-type sugar transport system substrate-binding protein
MATSVIGAGLSADAKDSSGNLVIGVEYGGLLFPYHAALKRVFVKHAQDLGGIKLIEGDSANDSGTEMNNVENIIQQKPDCFLLFAVDFKSPAAAEALAKAGIPVVAYDVHAAGPITNYVSYDQTQAGQLLAQFVIDEYKKIGKPKIKVIYLRGKLGNPGDVPRNEGFKKALADAGMGPDKVELLEQYADWDRAKAESIARDYLSQNPDVDVVIGLNDDLVLGAKAAAEALKIPTGPNSHLHLMGVDGIPEAAQDISDGTVDASAAMEPIPEANKALDNCVALAKGQKIESETIKFVKLTQTGAEKHLKENSWVYSK